MTGQNDTEFGRRELLARASKAGIAIAGCGVAAYLLYDGSGPRPGIDAEDLVTLSDFSVPPKTAQTLSVATGSDRAEPELR